MSLRRLLICIFQLALFAQITLADEVSDFPFQVPQLPIHSISFHTVNTLSYQDLAGPLPIRPGEILTQESLSQAVQALYRRQVFEHVDVKLVTDAEGVNVEFLLTQALTVFDVEFSGEETIDEKQLRRLGGVRLGEALDLNGVDAAVERIKTGYRREGYYAPQIKVVIKERLAAPQVIVHFEIDEGYLSKISKVDLIGELPAELASLRERLSDRALGASASEENIKRLRLELLSAMRSEGYLQASVEIEGKNYSPLTGDVELKIAVQAHDPISIIFEGNKRFSAPELLRPLRLKSRTVPFTPSAIRNLCKEIVKIYQRSGYFFAKVDSHEEAPNGARRVYTISVDEGRRVPVNSIEFQGNTAFTAGELAALIQTKPAAVWPLSRYRPGYLESETLSSDLAALENFYAAAGYLDVKVSFEMKPVANGNQLELHFTVEEGKLQRIEELKLEWKGLARSADSDPASEAGLLAIEPELKEGEPFERARIQAEQTRLTEKVIEAGYPNAQVLIDADAAAGKLTYSIDPGPQITVGKIWVAGNIFTHDNLVQRELKIHPGHIVRPEDIRASEQSLYRLGYFKNVNIVPTDGTLDDSTEDLTVQLTERDTGTLDLGTAYSTEDGIHVFTELGQRNLGGEGQSLVIGVDGYVKSGISFLDAGNARALFTQPHIFGTDAEWYNEAFAQYSIKLVDPYSYNRAGLSTNVRYLFTEDLRGSVGLTAYHEYLYDVPADVIIGPDDVNNTLYSFLNTQLDYDRRDSPYNPRRGYRAILQGRLDSEALGSDVNFYSVDLQQSGYLPVSSRLVWANNLHLQYLQPFGNTDVIPLSQRIFLGGRNSLRGFSRNAVGPRGFDGHIVGGDAGTNLNTELQYDLTESLVGLVFLDVGQAFLENKGSFEGATLSFSDLRFSPGIGFRYKTPIGPIRTELGLALDRENGERFGRFNFGVGGAF
ncbi:MAG: outer membrane protein assembly factor BamA [Bdellovibrionota bacterium]